MKKEGIIIICLLMVGLLCFPSVAAASGSSHGEDHAESDHGHDVPWYRGFNLWKTLNLSVLIFVLYKLLFIPIKRLLHERTFTIEEALKNAENAKSQAREELEVMQKRFTEAKDEIEEILEKGRADAHKVITEINKNTERTIEVMKKRAQDDLEQEFLDARRELQVFVAAETVKIAEQKIEKMDLKKLQSTYLNKFQKTVKLLGGNGEGS